MADRIDLDELPQSDSPRVDTLIQSVMKRFPGISASAQARYYEEVHQHLAPLARNLERELAAARASVREREADAGTEPQSVVPAGWKRALHEAVGAIYFNDNSDYLPVLWNVVRCLAPEFVEELQANPSSVWRKTEAMMLAAVPQAPSKGAA